MSRSIRSVWLFARPLSLANLFSPLGLTSAGKYHLCHWGVLVTPLSARELRSILIKLNKLAEECPQFDGSMGTMWELNRVEGTVNTVNKTTSFSPSLVRKEWKLLSACSAGETTMTDEEIQVQGATNKDCPDSPALRIIKSRPDYKLYENNCQNFAKYLVETISPGSFCPDTIQSYMEQWLATSTSSKTYLPGAYPRSIQPSPVPSLSSVRSASSVSVYYSARSSPSQWSSGASPALISSENYSSSPAIPEDYKYGTLLLTKINCH